MIGAVAVSLPAAYGIGLRLLDERCAGIDACSPYVNWDRTLLGAEHTYAAGTVAYDPEGIAVCIAATSLVLVGYLAGRRLASAGRERLPLVASELAGAGAVLLALAAVVDPVQPAVKRLFTPAYVALAAGIALVGACLFVLALDAWRSGSSDRGGGAFPLVALGRNALVVYLLERFLLQTSTMVHLGDRTLRSVLLDALPGTETTVHLAFTMTLLLVVVAVTSALHWHRRYVTL